MSESTPPPPPSSSSSSSSSSSAPVALSASQLRSQSIASAVSVPSLLSTLRLTQTYDYLRAATHPELSKFLMQCARKEQTPSLTPIAQETIQFADDVIKINRKQKRQERVLIITDKALYNFAPGSFKQAKRRILISDLRGIILSRCSDEIIFQVADSYDYRYEIKRRSEVLEMLSRCYESVMSDLSLCDPQLSLTVSPILMVSFSEEKELRDMCITKDVLKTLQQVAAANALRNSNVNGLEPVQVDVVDHDHTDSDSSQPSHPHLDPAAPPVSHLRVNSGNLPSPTSSHTPVGCVTPSHRDIAATTPAATPTKSFRQSLITHGQASLLAPHLLAKIAAASSGNFPNLAKQSHALLKASSASGQFAPANSSATTNGAANAAGSPSTPAHRSMLSGGHPAAGAAGGGGYHSRKHASIMISPGGSLMSGSFPTRANRSASRTVATPQAKDVAATDASSCSGVGVVDGVSGSSSMGGEESISSQHAFRDPNSRLEGWLTKQKGSSKKWDRKYFILTHRSLQYYAPRIKGNVKLKANITVSPYNSDTAIAKKGSNATSSQLADDTSLVMLRIESCSPKGKEALILAFASDEDAQLWSEGFLMRNLPAAHSDADQYLHLEGWLLRKEKDRWHRRYVVLTHDRVWFFEMVLKGSVEFTKGVSAHSSNQIQPTEEPLATNFAGRYALTRFAYRWNVSDAVRIFHLAADSEEDMAMWISAIDQVNHSHGKGGGSSALTGTLALDDPASGDTTPGIQIPSQFREAIEQPAPEGSVSFVFTDVQNSTSLWEQLPDKFELDLEQHDLILRSLLLSHRGYEVKVEGDAFMVAFFSPVDAARWCLAVQEALVAHTWTDQLNQHPAGSKQKEGDRMVWNGIRVRMGIHIGDPSCRRNPVTGRMDYFGPCVNRTARVSDSAHGGQIVCTQEIVDSLSELLTDGDGEGDPMVRDLGAYRYHGIPTPVQVYQLNGRQLAGRQFPTLRAERVNVNNTLAAGGSHDSNQLSVTSPTVAATAPAPAPAADPAQVELSQAVSVHPESSSESSLTVTVTPSVSVSVSTSVSVAPSVTVAGTALSVAPMVPPPPTNLDFDDDD